MTCTELVTADRILYDLVNGQISLIGFWDTVLLVLRIPIRLAFMVASTYTKEAAELQPDLSIRVYLNEGQLKEYRIQLNFSSGEALARSILHIQHLELPSSGKLQIKAWNHTQDMELFCRTYTLKEQQQQ